MLNRRETQRAGSVLALAPALVLMLCAIAAFSIDLGYVYVIRSQLRSAAAASALAAALELSDGSPGGVAKYQGIRFAELNEPDHAGILVEGDLIFGHWDFDTHTFSRSADEPNCVRTTVRRGGQHSDEVRSFFTAIWGSTGFGAAATATAAFRVTTNSDGEEENGAPMLVE